MRSTKVLRQLATLLLTALVLTHMNVASAQEDRPLGWDLSYESIFEQNNVGLNDWIRGWVKRDTAVAPEWIKKWNEGPINSSLLVEFPAFHAGERTTVWLVRTKDKAYYWEQVASHNSRTDEEEISTDIYDGIFAQASQWKQLRPRSPQELPDQALPGYIGIMSLYSPQGSRQMLLTMDDFALCEAKKCSGVGRMLEALGTIYEGYENRSYRHKSEAEIARMSPAQRIDEQIREEQHLLAADDKQSEMIRRHRRRDGVAGFDRLIELIESYNPKHRRDTRFYSAVMMAEETDNNAFRLRSSSEGRRVIDAIKALLERCREAHDDLQAIEWALEALQGANSTDRDIADTLWVIYRIRVSDDELLKFSNYLTALDPQYTAWSPRHLYKDWSRRNEAGNPRQVFVLDRPKKYRDAYLAFKRSTSHH